MPTYRFLYTHPSCFDAATCARIRQAMDVGNADEADVLHDVFERREDVRRAISVELDAALLADVDARLDALQPAVAAFFGVALSGREGAGFLRYPDGGYYAPHRDRADSAAWPAAARRCIALVACLNGSRAAGGVGDFDGGLLRVFMDDRRVDVTPAEGLLVAFPADLLHEVTIVRGGMRDVIVDWYYGS